MSQSIRVWVSRRIQGAGEASDGGFVPRGSLS